MGYKYVYNFDTDKLDLVNESSTGSVSLGSYVPYSGAVQDVDLNIQKILATEFITRGSGVYLTTSGARLSFYSAERMQFKTADSVPGSDLGVMLGTGWNYGGDIGGKGLPVGLINLQTSTIAGENDFVFTNYCKSGNFYFCPGNDGLQIDFNTLKLEKQRVIVGKELAIKSNIALSNTWVSGPYTSFLGGVQSGNIVYTLPTNLPTENQVLQSNISGVMSWVTMGAGSSITNHSGLTNLDYSTTGHTGFQPSGNYQVSGNYQPSGNYLTSETDPLSLHLDQSTPQTIINGAPLFSKGEWITGHASPSGNNGVQISYNFEPPGPPRGLIRSYDVDSGYYLPLTINGDYLKLNDLSLGKIFLASLTSNGFIKTIGGTGELSVDSSSYLVSGTYITDAPDTGSTYVRKTGSWIYFTTPSGGVSDHALLSNLDYASAGHTGFQPSGNYAMSGATGMTATHAFGVTIDAGTNTITSGIKGYLSLPYAGSIISYTLLADRVGSLVIDIWKDTYANYPPTSGDSICSGTKPTLGSAIKFYDSGLTNWTRNINQYDTLVFNVDSASLVRKATLVVEVQ
jgi:hypothetical protein